MQFTQLNLVDYLQLLQLCEVFASVWCGDVPRTNGGVLMSYISRSLYLWFHATSKFAGPSTNLALDFAAALADLEEEPVINFREEVDLHLFRLCFFFSGEAMSLNISDPDWCCMDSPKSVGKKEKRGYINIRDNFFALRGTYKIILHQIKTINLVCFSLGPNVTSMKLT